MIAGAADLNCGCAEGVCSALELPCEEAEEVVIACNQHFAVGHSDDC